MRVLALTTWFPSPEHSVQAPFNLEHVKAIAAHHDVQVIHLRLGSSLPRRRADYKGIDVLRLSFMPRRPWGLVSVLHEIRRELWAADLLHTMAFSAALFGRLAIMGTGKTWVHTEHWSGVLNPASVSRLWVALAWTRRILRRPDQLTGVTTQLADTLAGFGRQRCTSVVPCVVENPLPLTGPSAEEVVRLVAVGNLVEGKRPLLAVQTVRWLLDHGQQVRMVWVGEGPLRAAVLRECTRLGVTDRFVLAGAVRPDEVFGYLRDADIFFLPTRQENFFTAAAEALSAGRLVVAARVGGFIDYVDDTNSVLVDEASPENFGQAILQARERSARVSVEALALPIRKRFSRAAIGAQFNTVYALAQRGHR